MLGTPPAFVLSQDQTLHNILTESRFGSFFFVAWNLFDFFWAVPLRDWPAHSSGSLFSSQGSLSPVDDLCSLPHHNDVVNYFFSIFKIHLPVMWRVSVFYRFSSKKARDFPPVVHNYFSFCASLTKPTQALVFFLFYCYNINHRNNQDKLMTQICGKLSI